MSVVGVAWRTRDTMGLAEEESPTCPRAMAPAALTMSPVPVLIPCPSPGGEQDRHDRHEDCHRDQGIPAAEFRPGRGGGVERRADRPDALFERLVGLTRLERSEEGPADTLTLLIREATCRPVPGRDHPDVPLTPGHEDIELLRLGHPGSLPGNVGDPCPVE